MRLCAKLVICLTIFTVPARLPAQALLEPASLDCVALSTESASLKAELKSMNQHAGRDAQRQADAQKATAVTALAGQAVASFVGIVGVAISEGALAAQRAQVGNAVTNARENGAKAIALSRRVQALESERSRRCPKENSK